MDDLSLKLNKIYYIGLNLNFYYIHHLNKKFNKI